MKTRLLFNTLKRYQNHKNALLVTGMRQVGKTTLLKQVFETVTGPKLWFDLDNPLDQKFFEEEDYDLIYQRLVSQAGAKQQRLWVFIDEIQNYPLITRVVKYLIDHYQVKFYLTGSSNFYLKNLFPESLSGRKFLFELPPLSFREFLYFKEVVTSKEIERYSWQQALQNNDVFHHKKRQQLYEEYGQFGGLPEVVLTADQATKKLVLKNIFASFFEKDLKILSDYADIRELRDLILLLVPRVGSKLDVTRLGQELFVDRVKIYRYLEFLQGVFFIKLLPRFSRSIDRSVAGGRKVYFSDNGIMNMVGQVTPGQLLENTLVNQLGEYGSLSYYQKGQAAEIDLVVNKKLAVEVKVTGVTEDVIRLTQLREELGIKEGWVVAQNFRGTAGTLTPTVL